MQSPFKIFRKHQKVVLAALTLMAMIGFGIGDTVIKMVRVRASSQANKVVVETNIGNVNQSTMNLLLYRRRTIHRFIMEALAASQPELGRNQFFVDFYLRRFGFGAAVPPEVVVDWLYRHEARSMGLTVSDPEIEAYIKGFTNKKLSRKKFEEIVDKMQLSARELYDMFRDEMLSERVKLAKLPPSLQSPEKYWEYYQQLNTREKIEAAGIPVSEFTAKVGEPSESQLAALFEKHKSEYESASDGEFKPGFRQPRKVRLHYLRMSYTATEEKVLAEGPVSEKEIVDYYEKNKDVQLRFQDRSTPRDETTPIDPEFVPEKVKEPEEPEAESPAEKPNEEKKGSDCVPALNDDDANAKAPEDKPAAKSDSKEPVDEQPADSTKDESEDKPANRPEPESPSDTSEETGKEEPSEGQKKQTDGKKAGSSPPKVKYKPLDDELREVIRESIVRERTMKLMKEDSVKVRDAMFTIGQAFANENLNLSDPSPEQLKTLIRRSEEELRKLAESFQLKFGDTSLVTELELSEIPDLGRAQAREPGSRDFLRGESPTILQESFASERLCNTFEVEGPSSDTYLTWKVQNSPMVVPQFDDPGIREQVVKAWKRLEALPLAKKRADELAERAAKSGKELAEALGGETVSGDPGGLTLTVAASPEFSFYRESAAPMSFSGPQFTVELGNPIVADKAGRTFMKVVFDELGEGDVGVALNDDASVYYIVKVVSRRAADREAFKDAALFGPTSAYAQLAQQDRQETIAEYHRQMRDKYAIKWNDVSSRDVGPVPFDDE